MNKIAIPDTSVFLDQGKKVFKSFKNTTVIIPLVVIMELETKRNDPDLGYMARSVLRELKNFKNKGDIKKGVDIGKGSMVRIEMNHIEHPSIQKALSVKTSKTNDMKIISVGLHMADEGEVTIYTKDIPLALLADLYGLKSSDFVSEGVDREFIDEIMTFEVSPEEIEELFSAGKARLDLDVPANTGVVLRSGKSSALAIAKPNWNFTLVPDMNLSGLAGRSKEQHIGMKMMIDDTIKAVSLGGKAGTGKTAMALAAGHQLVTRGNGYKKIVVFRSMQAVGGEEMGFLPGTEQEKLDPWTKAVYDALESFLTPPEINKMKQHHMIEVLPITHIRGRTFQNSFIIVDEAQNLSKSTIMSLMTRVGQSSKIVLTHDVSQTDNIHVSRFDGIYEVVSRMHGNKLFGHVEMIKSERSELSQIVAELLDDY